DEPVESLAAHCVGQVQPYPRAKVVYVYAGSGTSRLTTPNQKLEPVPLPRFAGGAWEPTPPLTLPPPPQGQMNTPRSEDPSAGIAPGTADLPFAALAGGKLIGAFGFRESKYGSLGDVYLMTDLAVPHEPKLRLAKLVLAAVLSRETRALLEQRYAGRV